MGTIKDNFNMKMEATGSSETLVTYIISHTSRTVRGTRGGVVIKTLRHKPAGHGFDSRWCHWNISVT